MTVSVRMMKVMRWPLRSLMTKKFYVTMVLHGLDKLLAADDSKFVVDVKWKGPKRSLGPRFRSVKRERSAEAAATMDGALEWEQGFDCECTLALAKENGFYPWDVYLVVRKITLNGAKAKASVFGSGYLNLGEFAPLAGSARHRTKVSILGGESEEAIGVTLSFEEVPEPVETNFRIMAPAIPCISLWERDDLGDGGDKPMLRTKKSRVEDAAIDIRTSDESSQDSPDRFESDSVDNFEDSDAVDDEEFTSFRYGRIAGANQLIGKSHDQRASNDEEVLVFNGGTALKLAEETSSSDSDQAASQSSMRRMLSWRKRKLSFRSPRARRGEPLLNKAYGDNGGDEIDWDRRQAESPEESLGSMLRLNNEKKTAIEGTWDFGETFQVGSWEAKELTSRDGQMMLSASVFFASIDQRSESAAGESACTALVAVIADWLHRFPAFMPSRAEFDLLIREGSAEWRKLCQDATYKDRFPDGHFDLETVIEAAVRPLTVVPEKSFVGFFRPEGLGESSEFLEGAMSFDNIWDEVERSGPAVYIVSWNDHFFVVKVDEQSVHIIDTLGERLFEGCDQAYVLKFNEAARLSFVPPAEAAAPKQEQGSSSGSGSDRESDDGKKDEAAAAAAAKKDDSQKESEEAKQEEQASEEAENSERKMREFTGRNACKEFVKGFLAAIPLGQLQSDVKKGLVGKDHLHRRLQIEFHYTECKVREKNASAAISIVNRETQA
ncbi:uncharacterized protein LOC9631142 [Selaginella moellendorffii]|nr:uncharacterized protein LOC9631142 [Selaginella moellendorffii]|eukprot:XP_002968056.2 uncharacterized protein LOC9631142 [Selaginella moellendorffii]